MRGTGVNQDGRTDNRTPEIAEAADNDHNERERKDLGVSAGGETEHGTAEGTTDACEQCT